MSQKTSGRGPVRGEGQAAGERPRFFPRQMITAADLTQLVDYQRERQRRHNRALHGWGVVYGAEVLPVFVDNDPRKPITKVKVTPGFILTPQGDEFEITAAQTLDPNQALTGGGTEAGGNPWFSDVPLNRGQGVPSSLFLAVRYKEVKDGAVQMPPAACGCDETACEYTRLRDCYEFGLLEHKPQTHTDWPGLTWAQGVVAGRAIDRALLAALLPGSLPSRPEGVADGWVVLAELRFDQANVLQSIDPVSPRRVVLSLAPVWWQPLPAITQVVVVPGPTDGNTVRFQLQVSGKNLFPRGPLDVKLSDFQVDLVVHDAAHFGEKLTVSVSHQGPVTAGSRTLEVSVPSGMTANSSVAIPSASAGPAITT